MASNDNKRVAKNAIFLTFRLLISTAVSLYTSRIVLEVLGVDNFGVYGLVGGIVSLFALLNSSMSITTSRFITYELGKGSLERLKLTFSSSFVIHLLIATAILILSETIGLWFLNTKLEIPPESMFAANWVYQFSILSAIMSVTQVPYTASIMAHEKMSIYAYIELINTFLRLLIVYALLVIPGDKLILYGALQLIVSICTLMISRIYCMRNFEESKLRFRLSKDIVRPMLSFISWNFLFSSCITIRKQGTIFIVNILFGVAINAAASLAGTVTGVVGGFFSSVLTAFQPQIVKKYASGNVQECQTQTIRSFVFSSFVCTLLMVPLYFNVDFVLSEWLVSVPDYVASFIQINLFILFIEVFNNSLYVLIQASGAVKNPSIINGCIYLLNLPLIYLLVSFIHNPNIAYLSSIGILSVILFLNCIFVKKNIPEIVIKNVVVSIIKCFISLSISLISFWWLINILNIENNISRLLFSIILASIISTTTFYFIAFDSSTKVYFKDSIKKVLHKFA